MRSRLWWWALVVVAVMTVGAHAVPAHAQALAQQVLALYPPQVGEVVFIDLQVARRSPHFAQIKTQVLPGRFLELERLAASLGVDFDRNVDRLSWAFVNASGDMARVDFLGVAEGAFYLDDIQKEAAELKLGVDAYRGAQVYSLGKNERGQEFVFAFRDNATCLFGFRPVVTAMLDRAALGGASLLDNAAMRALIDEVNRNTPIWLVLDGDFTQLGVRQFLGEGATIPGVETLTQRVRSATMRIGLDRGLDSTVAARCATAADAVWFSAFLQGALFFQRQRLNDSNPTLARILGDAQLQRTEERVSLAVSVPESDVATLIQTRSFAFRF